MVNCLLVRRGQLVPYNVAPGDISHQNSPRLCPLYLEVKTKHNGRQVLNFIYTRQSRIIALVAYFLTAYAPQ